MQTINKPLYIGFSTKKDALEHRATYGGRVFVGNEGGPVIWFSSAMTPSQIFSHPIQVGLSGRLD